MAFSDSPLGYQCVADAECGLGKVCRERHCALPFDAGITRSPQNLWVASYTSGYLGPDAGLWHDKPPHFTPSAGQYRSTDTATITRHIQELKYAQFDAVVVAWYGEGLGGDQVLALALDAGVPGDSLQWGVLDRTETQGAGNDAASLRRNMKILRDRYGHQPNAFRLDGGFVVFVDFSSAAGAPTACTMATKWMSALRDIDGGLALTMRSTTGDYKTCPDQPFAWFGDSAASAIQYDVDSIGLSPGYWRWDLADAGLERNPTRFAQDVVTWRDAGVRFHYLTSFNAWQEGSNVESAVEWASPSGYGVYLDILHNTLR